MDRLPIRPQRIHLPWLMRPCCCDAGDLVMKMALQALLPNFLDLLVVDYNRWAARSGSRDQAAGSLISK